MKNLRFAIAMTLTICSVLFAAKLPAQTQISETPTPPTTTQDVATILVNGDLTATPPFAMLVGAQGSATGNFRARYLVACDQDFSDDFKGKGAYGIANANKKAVRVCSYSISNGSIAQDVQFVAGTATSAGSNYSCEPGVPISAKFHLAPNQFVSQGSGVGVLFSTSKASPNYGLCLKVYGGGDVGINVTYATP